MAQVTSGAETLGPAHAQASPQRRHGVALRPGRAVQRLGDDRHAPRRSGTTGSCSGRRRDDDGRPHLRRRRHRDAGVSGGGDPGSVIAWYRNGQRRAARPRLRRFQRDADDWLDWDSTNDPFTVTSGDRQPGPDDDDEAVTSNAAAVVTAMGHFPGQGSSSTTGSCSTSAPARDGRDVEQLTQDGGTSGYAIAVYVEPSRKWHIPDVPRAYDPWWWLKNSPVEGLQQLIRQQGEAAQITSLIDSSTAITSSRARSMVQHVLRGAAQGRGAAAARGFHLGEGGGRSALALGETTGRDVLVDAGQPARADELVHQGIVPVPAPREPARQLTLGRDDRCANTGAEEVAERRPRVAPALGSGCT